MVFPLIYPKIEISFLQCGLVDVFLICFSGQLWIQQVLPHIPSLQLAQRHDQRCHSSSRLYGTPSWVKSPTRMKKRYIYCFKKGMNSKFPTKIFLQTWKNLAQPHIKFFWILFALSCYAPKKTFWLNTFYEVRIRF